MIEDRLGRVIEDRFGVVDIDGVDREEEDAGVDTGVEGVAKDTDETLAGEGSGPGSGGGVLAFSIVAAAATGETGTGTAITGAAAAGDGSGACTDAGNGGGAIVFAAFGLRAIAIGLGDGELNRGAATIGAGRVLIMAGGAGSVLVAVGETMLGKGGGVRGDNIGLGEEDADGGINVVDSSEVVPAGAAVDEGVLDGIGDTGIGGAALGVGY